MEDGFKKLILFEEQRGNWVCFLNSRFFCCWLGSVTRFPEFHAGMWDPWSLRVSQVEGGVGRGMGGGGGMKQGPRVWFLLCTVLALVVNPMWLVFCPQRLPWKCCVPGMCCIFKFLGLGDIWGSWVPFGCGSGTQLNPHALSGQLSQTGRLRTSWAPTPLEGPS